MRGTNYGVGFGITLFFILGGLAFIQAANHDWPFDGSGQVADLASGAAADTFRMIGWIWFGVGGFLLLLFLILRIRAYGKDRVVTGGIDGTATVVSADTTGTMINEMPVYKIEVDVTPASGGLPRRHTKREIVPFTAMGRWGVGTQLPVRIDADDPDRFVILWDALPPPGMGSGIVGIPGLFQIQVGGMAPQTPAPPASKEAANLAELGQLHDLFQRGAMTEAEYNQKKWEILSRS